MCYYNCIVYKLIFILLLFQTDWLDKESKHNALDKLAAMEIYVGAHDKLLNNDLINKYHEGLYLDNVNYLQNYLNASRFEIDKSFRRLRQTVRESHILNEFSQAVITPNAVFYLDSNTISMIYFNTRI